MSNITVYLMSIPLDVLKEFLYITYQKLIVHFFFFITILLIKNFSPSARLLLAWALM